jgi:hypothetical protein
VSEDDARDLLGRLASDGLEDWIVDQPWQAVPGGWTVTTDLQDWQFWIEVVATGFQITASVPGSDPTVWVVTAMGKVISAG